MFKDLLIDRYAQRYSRCLPCNTPSQTSYDVFGDSVPGNSSHLQKVHAIGMPSSFHFSLQPLEIYVDDESKLTLHGLQQYYIRLPEAQKNRKLNDLLDALEFNQVVIFVKSVGRASELDRLLRECNFPSITIHGGLPQEERYIH